jgi:hypothetical protein
MRSVAVRPTDAGADGERAATLLHRSRALLLGGRKQARGHQRRRLLLFVLCGSRQHLRRDASFSREFRLWRAATMGITTSDPSVAWSVGSSSSRYLSMEIRHASRSAVLSVRWNAERLSGRRSG